MKRAWRLTVALVFSLATHAAFALLVLHGVTTTHAMTSNAQASGSARWPVTLLNFKTRAAGEPAQQPAEKRKANHRATARTTPVAVADQLGGTTTAVRTDETVAPTESGPAQHGDVATARAPLDEPAAGNGVSPGSGQGSSGASAGTVGLAALNEKLRTAATRCYPAAAGRFRLTGTAKVAFCVGSKGSASEVRLVKSTGSTLLDSAACGCVLERAVPLPAEVSGRCFELPVTFRGGS